MLRVTIVPAQLINEVCQNTFPHVFLIEREVLVYLTEAGLVDQNVRERGPGFGDVDPVPGPEATQISGKTPTGQRLPKTRASGVQHAHAPGVRCPASMSFLG